VKRRRITGWVVVTILAGGILAARRLPQAEEPIMQTLTETVTVQGRSITVTTTRRDGESLGDWIKRHDEAVAAVRGGS
jgi:multidrug efflux pump subunit AcrB